MVNEVGYRCSGSNHSDYANSSHGKLSGVDAVAVITMTLKAVMVNDVG